MGKRENSPHQMRMQVAMPGRTRLFVFKTCIMVRKELEGRIVPL